MTADFPTWAAHYDYDPATTEAEVDYAAYVEQGERMSAIFGADPQEGGPMKILDHVCELTPLDDVSVIQELDRPGRTRALWKCPRCQKHWIAEGSRSSKETYRVVRTIFGWARFR